jgi:triacylglycerol esterase/lipase EstA (alpha/beta hydrolase family)
MIRRSSLLICALLAACGDGGSADPANAAARGLVAGAGPDGSFYAAPPDSTGRPVQTRWPILFSHAWSRTADTAFQGDEQQAGAEFDQYAIKRALEAEGVVVFQPDKLAYASHERRGQLLYRKCAGTTIAEILCEGANPQVIDGVHLATQQYCADPALRARHAYADEPSCRRLLQFNIICHSQGCADSRYMMAAVRNEYSGELMYRHVASWTSMAGANKGTAQADWIQELLLACLTPGCRSLLLDLAFAVDSFSKNEALIVEGGESVIALTRKYMLSTTDMRCAPDNGETCAPSFNALYPLPVDPEHPVLYQTFSSQIDDISHPCYESNKLFWDVIKEREGDNDGNISVNSQRFTTYGHGKTGEPTPVIPRWFAASSNDPQQPHPGLNHMAANDSEVPGIPGVSCDGEDNSAFYFSRQRLYRDIVAELARWGY